MTSHWAYVVPLMLPLKMTSNRVRSRLSTGPNIGVQSVFKLVLETASVAMVCPNSGGAVTLLAIVLLANRTREERRVILLALGSNIFVFLTGIGGCQTLDIRPVLTFLGRVIY